jgi:hypothetical protein
MHRMTLLGAFVVISYLLIIYSGDILIVPGFSYLTFWPTHKDIAMTLYQLSGAVGILMLVSSLFVSNERYNRILTIISVSLLSILPISWLIDLLIIRSEFDPYFMYSSPFYFVLAGYLLYKTLITVQRA